MPATLEKGSPREDGQYKIVSAKRWMDGQLGEMLAKTREAFDHLTFSGAFPLSSGDTSWIEAG